MTSRKLRTYEPIWIQLKKDKFCRIAALRVLHKRIIKAVIKEKYMDIGYKYELQEKFKKAVIVYKSCNSSIEFTLEVKADNYVL